jgi:hypothetical protein
MDGIRADPDSSRHDLGVAIASVALLKRECGRSVKPRSKRGVWECAQWSKGRGRLVGGMGGRPSEAGECAHSDPTDIIRRRSSRTVEIGGVLRTDTKASFGKRVGIPG